MPDTVPTPVLDAEAAALSVRFDLPMSTARSIVRQLLTRLDHSTLRALRIETTQEVAVAPPPDSQQKTVGETARQLALDLRQLDPKTQALRYTVDPGGAVLVRAELLINAEAELLDLAEALARQNQVEGFLRNWPANLLAPFDSAPGVIYLSRLDQLAAESGEPLVCDARR